MIEIMNVDCSRGVCTADVVLAKALDAAVTVYKLSLEVTDTEGEATVVPVEIQPTRQKSAFVK